MVENFIVQDTRYNYVFCYTDTTMPADSVVKINNVNAPTSRVYTSGNGWNPGVGNSSLGVIGFSYNTNSFVFGGNFQISNSTGVINVSSYAGVVSGLVLSLDAGLASSYPGSGSTWTDVSGNSNNGTLINSPTYSTTNGGYLSFNGTNQYVNISNSSSLQVGATFTVCAWVRPTTLAARYAIFSTRANSAAGGWQLEIGSTGGGSLSTNRIAFTGVGTWLAETFDNVIATNQWYYICLTKVNNATNGGTFYINGASVTNRQTNAYTISNNNDPKRIATSNGTELFTGDIAEVTVYNTALNAAQIFQNYNSTCGLFGFGAIITRNLQLYLDAGNRSSYPGSGATWSDLSGNSNNCTLVNSPTYNSSNGGSIVFNGSTQYGSVANAASLNGTTQTISVWYNTTNNLAGRGSPVLSKTDATNSLNGYNLFANSSAQFKNATQTTDTSSGTVTNSTWVNVTMTFTSGGNSLIYINGSLAATTAIISFTISSQPLRIGISLDTFWTAFAGNIASIAIYNRALSQGEIAQNFNTLKSRYGL